MLTLTPTLTPTLTLTRCRSCRCSTSRSSSATRATTRTDGSVTPRAPLGVGPLLTRTLSLTLSLPLTRCDASPTPSRTSAASKVVVSLRPRGRVSPYVSCLASPPTIVSRWHIVAPRRPGLWASAREETPLGFISPPRPSVCASLSLLHYKVYIPFDRELKDDERREGALHPVPRTRETRRASVSTRLCRVRARVHLATSVHALGTGSGARGGWRLGVPPEGGVRALHSGISTEVPTETHDVYGC